MLFFAFLLCTIVHATLQEPDLAVRTITSILELPGCSTEACKALRLQVEEVGVDEAAMSISPQQIFEILCLEEDIELHAWMFPWLREGLENAPSDELRDMAHMLIYNRTEDLELIKMVYGSRHFKPTLPSIPPADLEEIGSNLYATSNKAEAGINQYLYMPSQEPGRKLFDRINRKSVVAISAMEASSFKDASRCTSAMFTIALLTDYIIPSLRGEPVADDDAEVVLMVMRLQKPDFSRYLSQAFHALFRSVCQQDDASAAYTEAASRLSFHDVRLAELFEGYIPNFEGFQNLIQTCGSDANKMARIFESALRVSQHLFPEIDLKTIAQAWRHSETCEAVCSGNTPHFLRADASINCLDVFWTAYHMDEVLYPGTVNAEHRFPGMSSMTPAVERPSWLKAAGPRRYYYNESGMPCVNSPKNQQRFLRWLMGGAIFGVPQPKFPSNSSEESDEESEDEESDQDDDSEDDEESSNGSVKEDTEVKEEPVFASNFANSTTTVTTETEYAAAPILEYPAANDVEMGRNLKRSLPEFQPDPENSQPDAKHARLEQVPVKPEPMVKQEMDGH